MINACIYDQPGMCIHVQNLLKKNWEIPGNIPLVGGKSVGSKGLRA